MREIVGSRVRARRRLTTPEGYVSKGSSGIVVDVEYRDGQQEVWVDWQCGYSGRHNQEDIKRA